MTLMFLRLPLIIALVSALTLFASCAKEDLPAPCGYGEMSNEKASDLGSNGQGTPANAASGGNTDTDGTDISDDGDDLSGSERNRKKRAN